MCGIVGAFSTSSRQVNVDTVREMTASVAHRGPDGEGIFATTWCAFGHRRLAIQDPTDLGRQPMVSDCGRFVLCFNGEIYNFKQLGRELRANGERLRSATDSEVLLRLFAREGVACFQRLRGMFAFAVADLRQRRLFLCRDRTGEKPLFFCKTGDIVYFASEIKAFWRVAAVSRTLNLEAIPRFFLHTQVPPPDTFFAGIHRLKPAHWMVIEHDGRVTEQPYWRLDFTAKQEGTAEALAERLDSVLTKAVNCSAVSDRPIGLLLSGGVDSSLVLALLAAEYRTSLECFTISSTLSGSQNPDEWHAKEQAGRAGLRHHIYRFSALSFGELLDAMTLLDEPQAVYDFIMGIFHCRAISKDRQVILSGSGADEIFGGYSSYLEIPSRTGRRRTGNQLISDIGADFKARANVDADAIWGPVLSDTASKIEWVRDLAWVLEIGHVDTPLDAKLLVELFVGMSHCASMFDTVGMASGVEVRSPFLCHEVVEFAAAVPTQEKVVSGERPATKRLLKRVAEKYLPSDAVWREKSGYSVGFDPIRAIRGAWKPDILHLLERHRASLDGIIDPTGARRVLDALDRAPATELERRRALKLVMFLAWYDTSNPAIK